MQDRGDDALAVHAHFREYARDGHWMADVGLTRNADLSLVRRGADQVSLVYLRNLRRIEIGLEFTAQLRNTGDVIAGANVAGNDFKQIGVVRPHHTPGRIKDCRLMGFYNIFTRR